MGLQEGGHTHAAQSWRWTSSAYPGLALNLLLGALRPLCVFDELSS